MKLPQNIKDGVLRSQINEATEHEAYRRLSLWSKNKSDSELFKKIAGKELEHYLFWKKISGKDVPYNGFKVSLYVFLAKFLGKNFGVQFMERSGKHSEKFYKELQKLGLKDIYTIMDNEKKDEEDVLSYINKDELSYTGAILLGLNDALVELTGALAGFTLALQQTKLVALAGFITGVAASFSMAASQYLSSKEDGVKSPLRASIYTGIAYLITVLFLISPYLYISNAFVSLAIVMTFAIFVIFIFNFYISVAKNVNFKQRVTQMILISLGVAIFNFFLGFLAKKFLRIEI